MGMESKSTKVLRSFISAFISCAAVTVIFLGPKAYGGLKEEVLSAMDRAYASSEDEDHRGAIKHTTKALKLLRKMGPEMLESDFAMYMYDVRAYSKYSLDDNKGACKDWQKVYSLGDEDAAEWIEEVC